MTETKTLLFDLEIAPLLGYSYEVWDATVIKVVRSPYIMCVGWKWLGDDRAQVCSQPDFPDWYEKNPHDDHFVCLQLHRLLNAADVVIGHNAQAFDNRIANTRFIEHGFKPPSPYKTVDTLKAARKYGRFGNNSLDKLCQRLGIGEKTKERHHDLWPACLEGDRVAWAKMADYCEQDVALLEELYLALRPYIANHANVWGVSCPRCGSANVQSRGVYRTNACEYKRFQCQECGSWSRERLSSGEKPALVAAT